MPSFSPSLHSTEKLCESCLCEMFILSSVPWPTPAETPLPRSLVTFLTLSLVMPQLDAKISMDKTLLTLPFPLALISFMMPPAVPHPFFAETFLVPPLLASQGSSPDPAHPSQDPGHILQPKASETFQMPMAWGLQFWNRAELRARDLTTHL